MTRVIIAISLALVSLLAFCKSDSRTTVVRIPVVSPFIASDSEGGFWVAGPSRAIHFDKDGQTLQTFALPSHAGYWVNVSGGRPWFVSRESGSQSHRVDIATVRAGRVLVQSLSMPEGVLSVSVLGTTVYLANNDSIVMDSNRHVTTFLLPAHCRGARALSAVKGGVWEASSLHALCFFPANHMAHWSIYPTGIYGLSSIAVDHKGDVWASTIGYNILRFRPRSPGFNVITTKPLQPFWLSAGTKNIWFTAPLQRAIGSISIDGSHFQMRQVNHRVDGIAALPNGAVLFVVNDGRAVATFRP